MNNHTKTDHVARENILRLLSDDEVASVSRIETTARLLDGEEYLDLEEIEQGVRSAFGTTPTPMGQVLARRAVHATTWDKILERLAMLHVARAQTGG
jgi:hypothetical protein